MQMSRKKNISFFVSAGLFCLLGGMILSGAGSKEKTYTNPVLVDTVFIRRQAPDNYAGILGIGDPAVLFHEGSYYLYPTGDNHGYDVYVSTDLVNWRKGPRVFYAEEPGTWAPDVFYDDRDGKFYLYYTVNGRIGVAVADRPDAVFRDLGPLIKHAIDAHMFVDDDGRYYLYYVQYPGFIIHVQPMTSPVAKKGEAVRLLQPTELWERQQARITEAPWMLKHKGVYYLLYSAGGADSADYAIGYATAETPIGPFSKNPANPLIGKGGNIFGPGHCSVTKDREGRLWMVYHQQKDGGRGWNRIICIDPLWFDDRGRLHGRATRGVPLPVPRAAG